MIWKMQDGAQELVRALFPDIESIGCAKLLSGKLFQCKVIDYDSNLLTWKSTERLHAVAMDVTSSLLNELENPNPWSTIYSVLIICNYYGLITVVVLY